MNSPHIKLMVATTNQGKRKEIGKYLLLPQVELEFSDLDLKVEEPGDTFAQNAFAKADAYAKHWKYAYAVLSEDSGVVLDAYPKLLGVQTANYQAHLESYQARAEVLLDKFKQDQEPNRGATFFCVMCLRLSEKETYFFTGKVRGSLAESWRPGLGGFGYDGIFIPEGQAETFSQNTDLKQAQSHRQRAIAELVKFWQGRI